MRFVLRSFLWFNRTGMKKAPFSCILCPPATKHCCIILLYYIPFHVILLNTNHIFKKIKTTNNMKSRLYSHTGELYKHRQSNQNIPIGLFSGILWYKVEGNWMVTITTIAHFLQHARAPLIVWPLIGGLGGIVWPESESERPSLIPGGEIASIIAAPAHSAEKKNRCAN